MQSRANAVWVETWQALLTLAAQLLSWSAGRVERCDIIYAFWIVSIFEVRKLETHICCGKSFETWNYGSLQAFYIRLFSNGLHRKNSPFEVWKNWSGRTLQLWCLGWRLERCRKLDIWLWLVGLVNSLCIFEEVLDCCRSATFCDDVAVFCADLEQMQWMELSDAWILKWFKI